MASKGKNNDPAKFEIIIMIYPFGTQTCECVYPSAGNTKKKARPRCAITEKVSCRASSAALKQTNKICSLIYSSTEYSWIHIGITKSIYFQVRLSAWKGKTIREYSCREFISLSFCGWLPDIWTLFALELTQTRLWWRGGWWWFFDGIGMTREGGLGCVLLDSITRKHNAALSKKELPHKLGRMFMELKCNRIPSSFFLSLKSKPKVLYGGKQRKTILSHRE